MRADEHPCFWHSLFTAQGALLGGGEQEATERVLEAGQQGLWEPPSLAPLQEGARGSSPLSKASDVAGVSLGLGLFSVPSPPSRSLHGRCSSVFIGEGPK